MTILSFLASPRGRRFTSVATISAAVGTFSLFYFPHTFFAYKYREVIASYKDGIELPVSEALRNRFEVAVEILKLADFDRKFIEPFMVCGFDCYRIGSTKSKFGGFVGIPVNYTYTSKSDIDKQAVTIRNKPIDWNSEGGKMLEDSIVLTPDEQVFGIAREIIQLQSKELFLNPFYASGSILGYYVITSNINSRMKLFYRPLSLRLMFYGLSSLFVFGIYALLTDFTQVNRDISTDEQLASLGRGMTKAGARFYDKMLKKNIACREISGDNSQYTISGNENTMFRYKSQPLTERKSFFESKLKELEEQKKTGETKAPEAEQSPRD